MFRSLFVLILIVFQLYLFAQDQTVGLFVNDNNSYNGYILFSPVGSTSTYLIDNCGQEINTWTSNYKPNLSVYLLENGNLLRSCKTLNDPNINGRLEILDWDGNLVWHYNFGLEFLPHHDIEPLPNGNIIVISQMVHTYSEALDEGRNPILLGNELVSERIIEIQPVGENDMNIVWEWRAWDHLIQDYDETKNNFGVVADHPELFNINYFAATGPNALLDWLHFNSIAYNAEVDQIIVSARNTSEVYIIDHSTTTAEAADHSGGIYGKGGDILYRYGNPQAYNRGDATDRKFFFQHDAQWIPEDFPDGNKILVFNNQITSDQSGVAMFTPAEDSAGYYTNPGSNAYKPDIFDWEYISGDIYSAKISGLQQLANGNVIICAGTSGKFFEVDKDGNQIWSYINPVGGSGPVAQGELPLANNVFKVRKFDPEFPGFTGKDMTPGLPLELNPWPSLCTILEDTLANIDLNVFLEGPFNGSFLNESPVEHMPLSQPFNNPPWYYKGTEKVNQIPPGVVDWVIVELRDASEPAGAGINSVISRQAAFILTSGDVVGLDGTSKLIFNNSIENELYVSIDHRNHIGALSATMITKGDSTYYFDFTSAAGQAFGGELGFKEIGPGIWGMVAGDGNADNVIDIVDFEDIWRISAGTNGYLQGDFDLDSQVDNKDKNDLLFNNFGKTGQIPEG